MAKNVVRQIRKATRRRFSAESMQQRIAAPRATDQYGGQSILQEQYSCGLSGLRGLQSSILGGG
jgi:hypothetical protein